MNIMLLIISLELGVIGVGVMIYLLLDQRRRMGALRGIMDYWVNTAAERDAMRKERSNAIAKNLGLKEYEGADLQSRWRAAEVGFLSDTFKRLESNRADNFTDFAEMHARLMAEHDQALVDVYLNDKKRAAAVARQVSKAEAEAAAAAAREAAAATAVAEALTLEAGGDEEEAAEVLQLESDAPSNAEVESPS